MLCNVKSVKLGFCVFAVSRVLDNSLIAARENTNEQQRLQKFSWYAMLQGYYDCLKGVDNDAMPECKPSQGKCVVCNFRLAISSKKLAKLLEICSYLWYMLYKSNCSIHLQLEKWCLHHFIRFGWAFCYVCVEHLWSWHILIVVWWWPLAWLFHKPEMCLSTNTANSKTQYCSS